MSNKTINHEKSNSLSLNKLKRHFNSRIRSHSLYSEPTSSTNYHTPSTVYPKGFTIIELLVVIVVIAILAAITIVSYTGISQRAIASALQSDLNNNSKLIKMYYTDNGVYPTSMDSTSKCLEDSDGTDDTRYCLKTSNGNTFTYTYTPNSDYKFKLVATKDSTSYYTTGNTPPTVGGKNLLTDESASFEGGTVGIFTGLLRCTSAIVNDAWHGVKAIELTATADNTMRLQGTVTPLVVAGSQYTLSVRVKAGNAGAVGKVAAVALYGDASGMTYGATVNLTTGWKTVSSTKTFAAGDVHMLADPFALHTALNTGDKVLVDAIQLESGSVATPF